MFSHRPTAAALALLLVISVQPAQVTAAETADDEGLLREQGVSTDTNALVDFFRKRSLTCTELPRMASLVQQLGSEHYTEREAAARALAARGPAVRDLLQGALNHPDPEVARRAGRCLEELDRGPGPALPMAAARLLARRPPALSRRPGEGVVPVLVTYLPFAGDEAVTVEVLDALTALTARAAAPDLALIAALTDGEPARRAAAGYVLGRAGDREHRAAAGKLLTDPDPRVRYRTAEGLLAGRERAAVLAFIDLVPEAPLDLAALAEEVLQRLAGDQSPTGPAGDDPAARRQRRDAWRKWWDSAGARLDLACLDESPRLRGLTLIPEMHAGRVWECAADGKALWEITNLQCPIDAQALPGGRVLIAELHGHRVSERERTGKIVWQQTVDSPIACQRLPGGQTFIATNHRAFVVTADGKEASSYTPENGFFIHSIQRQRNGHVVCVSMAGMLREVDAQGKEVRSLTLPIQGGWSGIETVVGGRYLAVNNSQGRILELDAAGKIVWEHTVSGACYASRLANGHTLIVSNSAGLSEVDRMGKTVWQLPIQSSLWRARRR
jgi:hypothetical protein